jgi:hypothetical protein
VAVIDALPLASQMQDGIHTTLPTEARKIKRQSVAVGVAPMLTGCAQSPLAATTGATLNINKLITAMTVVQEVQERQPNSAGECRAFCLVKSPV